jgi:LysM repeat protein
MPRKVYVYISLLLFVLLSLFAVPLVVQAGGACGGTYIVQWGDTLTAIAQRCGVSMEAILAANPGLSPYLYAGQTLVIPGPQTTPAVTYMAYVVQPGDTFAAIAARFGVSMSALMAANPNIPNINILYVGQIIYIPTTTTTGSVGAVIVPTPTRYVPVPLSYGTAPARTPKATISLVNHAKKDVYVSLQGTLQNGETVIREYPVGRWLNVSVPAGWYVYVAWVGDQKFVGQFKVSGEKNYTISFYSNKVVVE